MPFDKSAVLPLDLAGVEGQFCFPDTLLPVISLDPGGTTGVAYFNPKKLSIWCGQINGEHHLSLYEELVDFYGMSLGEGGLEIVCESFEFRQHRGTFDQDKIDLSSKEYIGVVRMFCQIYDKPVYFQSASVAKGFVPDAKLEMLGWYSLTKGMPHARDALRHLIYHLIVTKKIRKPFVNAWLTRNHG